MNHPSSGQNNQVGRNKWGRTGQEGESSPQEGSRQKGLVRKEGTPPYPLLLDSEEQGTVVGMPQNVNWKLSCCNECCFCTTDELTFLA